MNPLLPNEIENAVQYCAIEYRLKLLSTQEDLTGEEITWMERAEQLVREYENKFE